MSNQRVDLASCPLETVPFDCLDEAEIYEVGKRVLVELNPNETVRTLLMVLMFGTAFAVPGRAYTDSVYQDEPISEKKARKFIQNIVRACLAEKKGDERNARLHELEAIKLCSPADIQKLTAMMNELFQKHTASQRINLGRESNGNGGKMM